MGRVSPRRGPCSQGCEVSRSWTFRLFSVASTALILVATPQLCPSQETQSPVIRAESNLVLVQATFTDRHGRRIRDINPGDLIVFDDGITQELKVFRSPSERLIRPETHDEIVRAEEIEPGANALVILLPGMEFANRSFATKAVAKYLTSPLVGFTFVGVADATGLVLPLSSVATDRVSFANALLKEPCRRGYESSSFREGAMRLLHDMAKVPGRRAIVVFSDYYKPENWAAWVTSPSAFLPKALEMGAAIYPVDSRGVSPVVPFGDASTSLEGAHMAPGFSVNSGQVAGELNAQNWKLASEEGELTYIAYLTGGTFAPGNDMQNVFRDAERDASSTFLLGYYVADMREDGRFHRIKIQVKRRGVRVRAKEGYYAPLGTHAQPDASAGLNSILSTDRPLNDVQIVLRSAYFPYEKSGLATSLLTFAFRWHSRNGRDKCGSKVHLRGTIRPTQGKIPWTPIIDVPLPRPTDAESETPAGACVIPDYSLTRDLPPGDYQLKVVAATDEGDFGTAVYQLAVPRWRADKVTLSSVVLSEGLATNVSSEEIDVLNTPFGQITPRVVTEIAKGTEFIVLARVVGVRKDEALTAELAIKDSKGRAIYAAPSLPCGETMGPHGSALTWRLALTSSRSEDGLLLVEISLKSPQGKAIALSSVPLRLTDTLAHPLE